jgi:hypothetical protein
MRIKKHDELRPKHLSTVSFHNHIFFWHLQTLKTKVDDVVGCIFEVVRMQCWWIFDFEIDYNIIQNKWHRGRC